MQLVWTFCHLRYFCGKCQHSLCYLIFFFFNFLGVRSFRIWKAGYCCFPAANCCMTLSSKVTTARCLSFLMSVNISNSNAYGLILMSEFLYKLKISFCYFFLNTWKAFSFKTVNSPILVTTAIVEKAITHTGGVL